MAPTKKLNTSGIEIPIVVTPPDRAEKEATCGRPGEFPFTRGVYPDMYRGRLWTMRQYAGFGTAKETNRRFKYLLQRGQTGLSVAFDLATQIGYDSDHPMALGEVGRTGVAIDSLEDMEALFDGIPLDKVSTSMTINSTAVILLAMYIVVGKKQGVPSERLKGTIQNDVLKEFIARGTYILPPEPSMRIITDIFAYGGSNLPQYNTISISGYHIREAGATAAQEVAFTLANGLAYCKAALKAGLDIDKFAPKLSFFFAAHNDLFEEVAKFRAARTIWARSIHERFAPTSEKSTLLRFHTQTGGSTLTAQQPENNIVRTTLQALAAVMGGTQSLHTNSYDEALSLPTEKAAEIALRTQQILAFESGCADSADPLAGSYYVEYLTSRLEGRITEIMDQIDKQGGAVNCIENGYYSSEISQAAYKTQRAIEDKERVVVGLNRFIGQESSTPQVLKVDPLLEQNQKERLQKMKAGRDNRKVESCLDSLRQTAESSGNIVGPVIEAVENYATVGEISEQFRKVWGEYHAKN
ncbi:MAG: methylmalonyl-CoA mutase family protein [candidate division Zixibacteria bacterium]|nr:methylmalonyl-CoA mutase family protein [candidate division Zixibacteria bacterium]MDH3936683.1 methylmalonyl-CoA mutase family protein [candidate division Zixibacteria bacterium]MDH4034624.1 methylmalonyl-CoA mutase family protein [candidate division Zixibacteria bacterium]